MGGGGGGRTGIILSMCLCVRLIVYPGFVRTMSSGSEDIAHTNTHIHRHTHTHTHIYSHTHTHTHRQTDTHTSTHTHTPLSFHLPSHPPPSVCSFLLPFLFKVFSHIIIIMITTCVNKLYQYKFMLKTTTTNKKPRPYLQSAHIHIHLCLYPY